MCIFPLVVVESSTSLSGTSLKNDRLAEETGLFVLHVCRTFEGGPLKDDDKRDTLKDDDCRRRYLETILNNVIKTYKEVTGETIGLTHSSS